MMIEVQKIDITTAPRHCGKPMLGAVPISEVYLMDCIAGLKHYPDKYFDLAVVDPPYGIGEDGKIADNGRCYEQVCLAEMFKFSTNVIGKLAYSTC